MKINECVCIVDLNKNCCYIWYVFMYINKVKNDKLNFLWGFSISLGIVILIIKSFYYI